MGEDLFDEMMDAMLVRLKDKVLSSTHCGMRGVFVLNAHVDNAGHWVLPRAIISASRSIMAIFLFGSCVARGLCPSPHVVCSGGTDSGRAVRPRQLETCSLTSNTEHLGTL